MKNQSKIKQALQSPKRKISERENTTFNYEKTEEALRESEAKYRELVENANSIIIKMDNQGKITFFNNYAQKLFGYSPEEIIGMDINIIVPPVESNGRDLKMMINDILRNPDGFVENINENILRNGDRVWISWRNKAIHDFQGNVIGNLAIGQDITQLKHYQDELRASELRFRSLFENNLDGMMITVIDGSILSVNARMCEMLGMTEREITQAGREGIVVKDDKLTNALEERVRTGSFIGELTFYRKDGSLMPAEVSSVIFKDLDGSIKTGQVVRDITKRIEADQALKQAHDELELRVDQRTAEIKRQAELLDLAHDAVIVMNEDGRIVFWSKGAQETYGWTKEQAAGKTIHNILKTEFPIPLPDIAEKVKHDGRWEGELTQTRKDGKRIVVLSRWALRADGTGEQLEIMEVNRDISVRKAKDLALRKASEYNRNLIEVALDPLVTIGPDGRITDVNSATEMATGYLREELIGTDFSRYFSDVKKARTGYKLAFKEGLVRDYELAIHHRDGHIMPVLYNAAVYKDESGKVVGVFAAARDISERKQADEEIFNKTHALEELNSALKVLLDHYKKDQQELEERIVSNIRVRIIPYLEKFKQTQLDIGQSALLEIIERSFHDISSPFLKMISSEQFHFTPKEIEIISLIREGKTTKEIGQILNIGKRTVDSYRDNIRGKLGLTQKKINLRTYLFSMNNTI